VTVLLGSASGGFTPAAGSPFPVGMAPQFLLLMDANSDAIPDLVTANFKTNNVSVLLGDGAGRFAAAAGSPFSTGSGPDGLAAGDFNGDGKPDLAVANYNSSTVSLLVGNGSGGFSFAPLGPFPVGRNPTSIIAVDVDGDGKLDLVTTNYTSNDESVLLGSGTGNFTADAKSPYAVGAGPTKVVTADLNGDGQPDLMTTNGTAGTVTVFSNGYPVVKSPVIFPGGVIPVFSTRNAVQPGSWFSIYGSHLTDTTVAASGSFPTSLGNVSVTVNGKAAYLWFVSSGQINAQAPDDTATGAVDVVVTSPLGRATAKLNLAAISPSFNLLDARHLAGVIITPKGDGAYAGGLYDIVGPAGAFTFPTRPVQAGETLVLFGVGFGPTTPAVPSGQAPTGSPATNTPVTITIGGVKADVSFAAISGQGLYQFNLTVPNVPSGERAVVGTVGGVRTQAGGFVTVK
jgi:uncharacterized protein (TIGR03437 family)